MRKAKFVAALLTLFTGNLALAQGPDPAAPDSTAPGSAATSTTRSNDPDLDGIRAGSKDFVDAYNKGDAAAIAGMWTETGDYVDGAGNTFVGRQAIEKSYADFFAASADAKLQLNIDSLKALSDTAAVECGTSTIEVPPVAAVVGRYEAIHVKVDGRWQMASVRDVVIQTNVAEQNLSDLNFLIGTWIAEEHGNKIESVCRWISDDSFIKRDYTTTYFDGTQTSGLQLIGWNPQGGYIQSWTFSPDGGYAVGVWMPTEAGWSAQMQGMTGSGISTTSVNLFRRLDDNAYVWQSFDRTVGGVAIDDTNEVVIKRQP